MFGSISIAARDGEAALPAWFTRLGLQGLVYKIDTMLTRRNLLIGTGSLALMTRAKAEPILTDDGLYKEPWFLESFLELADDLEDARKEGKRFVIMWELKGCPYCKETHFVNFARSDVSNYIKANFEVLQLNIIGSRRVTDFDGVELS